MTIFFTSDLHFDTDTFAKNKFRPFNSADEMNLVLLDGINSTVERKDILYILGDFARYRAGHFRHLIRCKQIHFIKGNHDRPADLKFWSSVSDTRIVKLGTKPNRIPCFLSHYPHIYWPMSHWGVSIHGYGHLHGQREEYLDNIWPERRSMDLGVDNYFRLFGTYKPFSETEILEILLKRKGHHDLDYERAYQAKLQERLGDTSKTPF